MWPPGVVPRQLSSRQPQVHLLQTAGLTLWISTCCDGVSRGHSPNQWEAEQLSPNPQLKQTWGPGGRAERVAGAQRLANWHTTFHAAFLQGLDLDVLAASKTFTVLFPKTPHYFVDAKRHLFRPLAHCFHCYPSWDQGMLSVQLQ